MDSADLTVQLKLTTAKKEAIFSHVNSLYNSAKHLSDSGFIDTRSKSEFLTKTANISQLYNEFNKLCDNVNLLEIQLDPKYLPNYSSFTAFETLYSFTQHIRDVAMKSSQDNQSLSNSKKDNSTVCKLPPIELPTFDGKPENWSLFYESFKTNIHNNKNLNNSQRVQYLVGRLSGRALNVFAGVVPNEENYTLIWNSLVTKYQDKRALGTMYLNNIFDIKPVSNNCTQLNNFVDRFYSSMTALKQLGISDLTDFIFMYLALKRLDSHLVENFELTVMDKNIPSCTDLVDFIRHHTKVLERSISSNKLPSAHSQSHPQGAYSQGRTNVSTNSNVSRTFVTTSDRDNVSVCKMCKSTQHLNLYECSSFKKLSPTERYNFIKANYFCVNCLSYRHYSKNCRSSTHCKTCNRRHHSLLHFEGDNNANVMRHENSNPSRALAQAVQPVVVQPESTDAIVASAPRPAYHPAIVSNSSTSKDAALTLHLREPSNEWNSLNNCTKSTILLSTAQVYVPLNGKRYIMRCLVDSASQNNIVTTSFCKQLNVNITPVNNFNIKSVGTVTMPIKGWVTLTIKSRFSNKQYNLKFVVVDEITDSLPTCSINSSCLDYLKDIPLADETWNVPGEVHAILGAQIFPYLLLGSSKSSKPTSSHAIRHAEFVGSPAYGDVTAGTQSHPPLLETSLGYIIMGEFPVSHSHDDIAWSFGPITFDVLNETLNNFWALEELPLPSSQSPDDSQCERIYNSTVTRDSTGRFTVSLPFKGEPASLGNSYIVAHRRLLSLERKFRSFPQLRKDYNDVITDYISNGYLSEIALSEEVLNSGYFIPHHAVVRPDKSTTKTRIVLDASAKTDTGVSLNDVLHSGPNLQADLFTLLLNFRLFEVAISADIKQMYLRINTAESHRKYQKILYRFSDNETIRVFQFNSVAFGLRSSPYLAMRTVRELASQEQTRFPRAAAVATSELFMDDLTSSVSSLAESIALSDDLIALFKSGGFDLVKWATNSPELLAHLPETHRACVDFTDDNAFKVLGLKWLPAPDIFSFVTNDYGDNCTKRGVLSTIARLFDVLGLVAPVILYAKKLLQEIWLAKIGWDDKLPSSIATNFLKFKAELSLLSQLKIPRQVGVSDGCSLNLVGFGDASMTAYGCVVYLHVTHPNGDTSIHLICSKSKVAPLKTVTLARLELCAALLLSKLIKHVYDTYNARYPINKTFAFSDSTVALSWIHSSPHRWQTFVANRVSKIHDLVAPDRFYHISGEENPSDCLSRGLLPSQILNHSLWWQGPSWISGPMSTWPISPFSNSYSEDIPEMRNSTTLVLVSATDTPLHELALRVSSWSKLTRIVVYVLRFIKKLPRSSYIEASDLNAAETAIFLDLQEKHFKTELASLRKGNLPSSVFRKLDLFLENSGLIRVGGRLSNANIPYDNRHPILLPRRDHIIDILIDHYHRINCHTGSHLLMSLLRQRYWIISARNIIRQRIRLCNFCFKVSPKGPSPIMASLPPARVQEAAAFTHTGVDYAGPISITLTRRRGIKSQKAYICLFICLTTKAIHIELASDLSSDCFLGAFKRFISRRGSVSFMYSDNGTNFIGAKHQLDELFQFLESRETVEGIRNYLNLKKITWKTIPPRAPHFGGVWEANVKSIKSHLYRTIGNQILTYEELMTVLAQVECILNSRPLCFLAEQPHEILTPAHFLMNTPLQYLPASDLEPQSNFANRKQLLDSLVQSYWRRWHMDYLHTLQLKQKWNTPDSPVTIGTVVLIHQDDAPPLRWPKGIVEEVYPGKDGVIRVALVRTSRGTFKRPVVKLCPLPSQ